MIGSYNVKPPLVQLSSHAIFSDFDGTLVDIAATPDAIKPSEKLPELLSALLHCSQGSIALVTGRRIEDISKYLNTDDLFISGCHGMEWSTPGETRLFCNETLPPLPEALSRKALAFAERHDMLTENKLHTLALHYRNEPKLESDLDHFLDTLLEPYHDLTVMRGKCIREIKPTHFNKAVAIEKLMSLSTFQSKTPVFIGDDVTDEYGFEFVNKNRGISIKVGAGESAADYRLASPADVLNYLDQLIQEHKKNEVA